MRATLFVLLCLAVLRPIPAEARWTEIRSANFLFVGDAPESQIRRIAQRLEQFREVMLQALPGAAGASPVPTVVLVFATQKSLQPVVPLFRGNAIELAGFFQSGEDVNYIALDAEFVDQALLTIFHEYAHFLVSNNIGPLPPWANEGLAELYEMLQERDGGKKAIIGIASATNVELLKASTPIPIRELIAITQQSPVYNEGNRRSVFYAESWALVHYLTIGNRARTSQFMQFLTAVRSGSAPGEAFSAAFGADAALLDRELFDYVRSFAFPALQFSFEDKVAAATVPRGQTIDDGAGDVYMGDLQLRVSRVDEGRTRLTNALKRQQFAARAAAALGMHALRGGQIGEAVALLERAAAQAPDDGPVQVAYGRALVSRLGEQLNDAGLEATLKTARSVLGRAVELEPSNAFAAGMLGYAELVAGVDLPRATTLLERAVRLAPLREQYRLFLAQVLVRQREFARATAQLGPLMASGRDPGTRTQARELLARAADMQTQPIPSAPQATAPDGPSRTDLQTLAGLSRLGGASSLPTPESTETIRPDLRPVGAGETRVLGQFAAIECSAAGVTLVVQVDGAALRLRAKELGAIDFISHRTEAPGSVTCGPQRPVRRVLATYRARPTGDDTGDAVAIELLPDGYVPRP